MHARHDIGPPSRRAHAPGITVATTAAVPLRHPALVLVALGVAVIVALSVTFARYDPDMWHHLAVGRYMWEQHRFSTTQLWTWPTYGDPDVNYAWGFEVLLWPFWKLGGLTGMYVWRWLTTLTVFALAWAAARRMGARGFLPLVVITVAAFACRERAQVRPETVAAILLLAEITLLEVRRHGGRIHAGWLVLIAWAWANTHITYYQFFVVLGIHLLAAWLPPRRRGAAPVRDLWIAGLISVPVMLVNPSGWRTLWQPFEYWLVWRHELMFRTVGELAPVAWSAHVRDGLLPLVILWPLLALARVRRSGLDRVEVGTCAFFTALILAGQRFAGIYAMVATAYVARDLDEWVRRLPRPRGLAGAWPRAGLAAAACAAVALPNLTGTAFPIRMGVAADWTPIGAGDFIRRHDLHGRMFNSAFDQGGYLVFRFWPRRDQLPFMGIHLEEGPPQMHQMYVEGLSSEKGWRRLEETYRFDYLVRRRMESAADSSLPIQDRDTAWARVFGDDAAYVYVRRHGPFARLAAESAYTVVPAAATSLAGLGARMARDSALRRRVERELWREVAGSPYHARALGLLANLALQEGRWEDARKLLREELGVEPYAPGARANLGLLDLQDGRLREGLRWLEEERRISGTWNALDFRRGQAAQAGGDLRRALGLYRRELRHDPGNREASDSVAALSRRLGGRR
jgi:hypothetical protein